MRLILKYIELDGKAPKHSFDTFSTDHKNYDDAGLILNNEIVVVDFDDYIEIGELIYGVAPTLRVHTNRGFHLYYKKPKTESINVPIRNYTNKLVVAGIKVDFKTGTRSQATIKQDGTLRDMDNVHFLDSLGELPELPVLLYPSKLSHDIYGIGDGDGRNSALYSHLLSTLEQYHLDDNALQNLATFVNEGVFSEKVDEKELQATINSVKTKKPSQERPRYLDKKDMIMTSEVLADKLDMHYFRGKLYFKKDSRFISDGNLLFREIDGMIRLMPNQHKQLDQLFEIKAHLQVDDDMPVQFRNGFTLFDDEIIEVDPGFTPYYFDVDYIEDAYDEHVDKFLDFLTCDRSDLRAVVEEVIAHTLMTKNFPHKAFFFQGEQGANGKSTFIKMIQAFSSGLNTSVSLDKFDDDTSVYSLLGKLINVADDIDASYLDKSSNFKTLASGDPLLIRPIYSPPIEMNNKATLIFTCNEMPTFRDKSGGVIRRMVVIPCDNTVVDRDFKIDDKLSTDNAKSYLLNLGLNALQRILKNGDISKSETIDAKTKEYFIASDSVVSYLESHEVEGKVTSAAYRVYTAYCEDNGLTRVGSTEFGRRLATAGYEHKQVRKDGKRLRIYHKK